jgi:hypothetical protein
MNIDAAGAGEQDRQKISASALTTEIATFPASVNRTRRDRRWLNLIVGGGMNVW